MVIKGSARGEPSRLARHLVSTENESATVTELRGVASDNLTDALSELTALSSGTRTSSRRSLYHASINVDASEVDKLGGLWLEAVDELETELGLHGHPRVVIRHVKRDATKNLREHYHVVWSRTNSTTLKVISDSKNYAAHERVSRRLEARWNLRPVVGVHTRKQGEPRPVARATHKDQQAAVRTGNKVTDVADALKKCWAETRDGRTFAEAVQRQGLNLAIGRRGIVAVDQHGTPHSLPRRLEMKAAEVQRRLIDLRSIKPVEYYNAKNTILRKKLMKVGIETHPSRRKSQKKVDLDAMEAYWGGRGLALKRYSTFVIVELPNDSQICDYGDRLEFSSVREPTDGEIETLVAAAKARGWTEIRFYGGSKEFQERARKEALRQGWRLDQISLECEDHLRKASQNSENLPEHIRNIINPKLNGETPPQRCLVPENNEHAQGYSP